MPSDRPPRPGEAAHLAGLLADASGGSRHLTPTELAELLWLAAHLPPPPAAPPPPAPAETHPSDPSERTVPPAPEPDPAPRPEPGLSPSADSAPPPTDDRIPLHLATRSHRPLRVPRPPEPPPDSHTAPPPPSSPLPLSAPRPPASGTRRIPLHVPVPPMLAHPLALQRAVRPLKRYVPSPTGRFLDEEATAHRIALLGGQPQGWLPVLGPAPERWLRLCVVHDGGATMPMWRPLVRELHTALAQSGVFRTVELHRAAPDGTVPARAASVPADGRTVILVISDCMGPQWREGPGAVRWHHTLHRWAARMPLAVVQPLPERLWRTTALPTTPGLLSAPHPAAPSAALAFTAYDVLEEPRPEDALPLPVLEPAANWLANWAALVTDPGGTQLPGSVGWLTPSPATPSRTAAPPAGPTPREDLTRLTAEELVLRFRSTASPEAFRLAGHLALGETQLPVMRLVHRAVERHPRPQHLAEVILSGMLAESPEGPPGAYDFRDGVRELLLRTLPRTARDRTRELLAQIGGLIDDRAGVAPGELRAVAHVPGRGGEGVGGGAGEAFATVTPESVRQLGGARPHLLGGRYRGIAQIGRDKGVWLADDLADGGEVVVVQRFLAAPGPVRASFADEAARLEQFHHPHVAAVHDHGMDGEVPYLVLEYVPGRNLDELLLGHPGGLPVEMALQLVVPLAEAVTALHTQGMVHGAISAEQVRLPRDRGPVLCGCTLTPYGTAAREADLLALGRLVQETYTGAPTIPADRGHGLPIDRPETPLAMLASAVLDLASGRLPRQRRGLAKLASRTARPTQELTCSLLGPPVFFRDGSRLPATTPESLAVLCMLVLAEGSSLSYADLAEGLWAAERTDPTRSFISSCLSAIRVELGIPVVEDVRGFSLRLPPDDEAVDLFRCRRLAAEAERARAAGDLGTARQRVTEAHSLWQGEPLDGVPGPAARAVRVEIDRLRHRLRNNLHALKEPPAGADSPDGPDSPGQQHIRVLFECVAAEGRAKAVAELGKAVSRLLVRIGVGPGEFSLRPGARDWTLTVACGVPAVELLAALLDELPSLRTPPPRLDIAVTVGRATDPAAIRLPRFPDRLRNLFDGTGQAIVVLPDTLHTDLTRRGLAGSVPFSLLSDTGDWYGWIMAPPAVTPLLLGFDGVFTHLFPSRSARAATLSLLSVVTEYRRLNDALSGVPLLDSRSAAVTDGHLAHPLDALRALAHHQGYAAELHARLTALETERAAVSRPLAHSAALHGLLTNRPVAIVTDTSHEAVSTYLEAQGLPAPRGGIHGRTADITRLMPDAECPSRALERLAVPPNRCLMLGASPHEAVAARTLGIPFVGHAPDNRSARDLRSVGVSSTVTSLREVVDLLRAKDGRRGV
ncbi:SAV_2336 N-terminal domain-related protein [Streptomyces venezuelae]|nr:SAV_2336 N-terminal domain-related protein [Streptomyces venezuelae]